nr:MAG TPA: hypothetical protein [Caudoviricetes sp.]
MSITTKQHTAGSPFFAIGTIPYELGFRLSNFHATYA